MPTGTLSPSYHRPHLTISVLCNASTGSRCWVTSERFRSHATIGPHPRRLCVPVSVSNSQLVYNALKDAGITVMSALPETWLVHLIRLADDDPEMILVRLAKEEEGVGISTGAHFAGRKSAML